MREVAGFVGLDQGELEIIQSTRDLVQDRTRAGLAAARAIDQREGDTMWLAQRDDTAGFAVRLEAALARQRE